MKTLKPSDVVALVVEDNEASLNYLLYLLRKLEVQVIATKTGKDALMEMRGNTANIMLLDINLGSGMSGLDLMEELRKDTRFNQAPIIAVTAYYGGGLHEKLLKRGFTDFLGKPYSFDQLKTILKKYGVVISD